jgi:hypothetical protein
VEAAVARIFILNSEYMKKNMMNQILSWWRIEKHNKSIHADCQKRRGFRYATATPLSAAGDARRYASGTKMRFFPILLMLFLVGCKSTPQKEIGSEATTICPEMLGVWYTDVTVQNAQDGIKRDIVQISRKPDGSAYLKGVSIYYETGEVRDWEFPSSWSCANGTYSELNERGDTHFKIIEFQDGTTVLFDQNNNLNALEPIQVLEQRVLTSHRDLAIYKQLEKFFGL